MVDSAAPKYMAKNIQEEIELLIEPVLDDMGIELVDVEYLSGRGRPVLRIYADRPSGITLDDCAEVSREIGYVLDVSGLFEHQYVLEVSSPGLNRPLKKEKDFLRAVGQRIRVKTTIPLKGRSNFSGVLQSVESGALNLELDDAVVQIPEDSVHKANLVFDFDNVR